MPNKLTEFEEKIIELEYIDNFSLSASLTSLSKFSRAHSLLNSTGGLSNCQSITKTQIAKINIRVADTNRLF